MVQAANEVEEEAEANEVVEKEKITLEEGVFFKLKYSLYYNGFN